MLALADMDARPRILVADDDFQLLSVITRALEQDGADVVRASSGDELIERLAEGPYALVITDISMPWMTGLQAMHSARYLGLSTPVIVMTALKGEEIAQQVAALGDNVLFLRKPFELQELEAAMAKLLHPKEEPARRAAAG